MQSTQTNTEIVLVYSLCCSFSMKRLHSGKMILAVVAMFPTSLFIASNYSYDTWVIGFVMIGMAYLWATVRKKVWFRQKIRSLWL